MENSNLDKEEKNASNNDFIFGTTQTCDFFSVSRDTLSVWAKQGCPKIDRGKWNIKEVMNWRGRTALAGKVVEVSNEFRKLKADADIKELKAEKEEITLAVLRGEFINKEEVDRQWSVIGNQLKNNLLLWSRTLASELAHLDMRSVEKVLTDATYDLLEQLSSTSHYKKSKKKKNLN
jgi:phage terminase Nu1 subunit (DNA packaging protein)